MTRRLTPFKCVQPARLCWLPPVARAHPVARPCVVSRDEGALVAREDADRPYARSQARNVDQHEQAARAHSDCDRSLGPSRGRSRCRVEQVRPHPSARAARCTQTYALRSPLCCLLLPDRSAVLSQGHKLGAMISILGVAPSGHGPQSSARLPCSAVLGGASLLLTDTPTYQPAARCGKTRCWKSAICSFPRCGLAGCVVAGATTCACRRWARRRRYRWCGGGGSYRAHHRCRHLVYVGPRRLVVRSGCEARALLAPAPHARTFAAADRVLLCVPRAEQQIPR